MRKRLLAPDAAIPLFFLRTATGYPGFSLVGILLAVAYCSAASLDDDMRRTMRKMLPVGIAMTVVTAFALFNAGNTSGRSLYYAAVGWAVLATMTHYARKP